MSYLLALETASKNCSIAIFENKDCISLVEQSSEAYIHAEMLNCFVQWALETVDLQFFDLSGVIISAGPGSYTGLRIGVSSAKAFCFSLDIPLVSVDTLSALALQAEGESEIIIPTIDARRDEIYCAVFNHQFQKIKPTQALVLNEDFFKPYKNQKIILLGDGAEKTAEFLKPLEIEAQVQPVLPSAKTLGVLGYNEFKNGIFEDLAYFEPQYLKNFINNVNEK